MPEGFVVWSTSNAPCSRGFALDPECRSSISVTGAGGGQPRRVAEVSGEVADPDWTRDGQRLVFSDHVGEHVNPDASGHEIIRLAVMGSDGSGRRHITEGPRDLEAAWDPTERLIAFTRQRGSSVMALISVGDIWVVGADGTGLRQVTSLPGDELSPTFTPDGRRIVFLRRQIDGPPEREPGQPVLHSLWSVRLDGTGLRRLTFGNVPMLRPQLSPDGRRIAFFTLDGLAAMRVDGSALRVYAQRSSNHFEWAPHGRAVVLPDHGPEPGGHTLWRIDVAEGQPPRRIAELPPGEYGGPLPDWVLVAPLPRLPDLDAPGIALGLLDDAGRLAGATLETAGGAITTGEPERLALLAADRTGVRHVRAAVTPRGTKPRYRRLRRAGDWRRLARRLRPGRYVARFRTRDARGNRDRSRLRLRVRR